MEVSKCVICSSNLKELYSGKLDVEMLKIFYDILIHRSDRSSRNTLASVTTDNFWSSIFELSYFCVSCECKVVSIVDLSSNVKSIQSTIKWLVDQMKMKIIKSTSTSNFETRNISKVVAKSNIKNISSTALSNKMDCFRSLAVIDFNPDVTIIKSEWPTEPLSEDMVHMKKVKFSYFWKMKSKMRSSMSSSINSCKPKKSSKNSLFCDSFTEREIIHINGLTKELLTLTNDQLDEYFVFKNEKYKCNACHRTIKNKSYAIKHYVTVHRNIKRWKCGYCGEGFYDRAICGFHIVKDHEDERETPLTVKTPLTGEVLLTELVEETKPMSSLIVPSKPNTPLFCDYFTESEIMRVNGLSKELLTLTKDQLNSYFVYKNEKYKCKACRRILKNRLCAIKHYVSIHRNIKKWMCGYCEEGYYDKTKCGVHILRDHKRDKKTHLTRETLLTRETHLTDAIEETKPHCVKCIICYNEFMQSDQEETQRSIFFDYCDAMNINYLHPYFYWNWNSVDDIPVFCDLCYGSVVTLCDLNNKRKEMFKSIKKIVLQLKTDIIVSMSQNGFRLNSCPAINAPEELHNKHLVDKIDYIRSAAIQELNPDLRLFKIGNYQRLIFHRNSSVNKGRLLHKNSLFSLLRDGECINLNPGLAEKRLPLTDEETESYLEFDPDTQKYKCRECSRSLFTKYGAENHVNKCHKQLKMFECKYCGKQYYLKSNCAYHIVNSHISERKTDNIISAPLPKLKLSTPDGVIDLGKEAAPRLKTDDIKKLPNGEGFMCALCSFINKKRQSVVKHAKSVHYKMARFQCEFCGFKQITRCQVTYHVQRVHSDEVKRRNILFESMPAHVTKRLEKRHCRAVRKSGVPVDMTGVNLIEPKQSDADVEEYFTASGVGFTCKDCGKTYTARLCMVYHVESIHLGIRTCECAICGRRFFKISQCRRHLFNVHSRSTSDNTKDVLISALDSTSVHDFSQNAPEDSSDGVNNNLMTNTDLRKIENSSNCNFETQKQQSLSILNIPYSKIDGVNIMIAKDDGVAAFNETNANFVKLEASGISNWEDKNEGALMQMESNDAWPSETSDEIEENFFQSEFSETKVFTHYETLALQQEQEAQEISNCCNDPLQSDEEKTSQTVNNKLKKAATPANDRQVYLYTLINEGDIIILPDVEMSDVYKYFNKIGESKHKCNKCSRIVKTDSKAKSHVTEVHHLVKRYQCSKCLKLYSDKFHSAEHFVTKHTQLKLYQCHICENTFGCNASLQSHIKTHLNRKLLCKICPLKFVTKKTLKRHYNNVHKSVLQQTVE